MSACTMSATEIRDNWPGSPVARCEEPSIAGIVFACPHEHIESIRACAGCAAEVQQCAGLLICNRCEVGEQSHECLVAVAITWDDGTITQVQDTEGRNLL